MDHYRDTLKVDDIGYVSLTAGVVPDRDIWAAANQYPLDPHANRLVLVRDAERVKRWKPLEDWLASSRLMPTVHLLFVSSDHEFPYVVKDGKSTGELKPHADLIKTRGRVIRCSTPAEEDQIAWLRRYSPMPDTVARYLLTRVAGDLGRARSVCLKARLFSGEPSEEVISVLCSESPGDNFVEELLAQRKPRALLALEGLPERDYSKTIGFLDSRLEVMGKLNDALRQRKTLKDVVVAGTVPQFLARALMPYAKYYDRDKRSHCRRVLAAADEGLRAGARVGVMESIVSLW